MIDFLCICLSVLVKWVISMGPYSGKGTPPNFGDYEAQRHWMELTTHLPVSKWYFFDLSYWGLDYPPLTAYHMFYCGKLAEMLNPSWVALNSSRGYESFDHAIFMRCTVLLGDFMVLIPAALMVKREFGRMAMMVLLFNPCLMLIDHGHFHYNSISLSLGIIAACLVCSKRPLSDRCLGCVCFTLSLFYKQMQLYHAFPFFFILIGHAWKRKTLTESITEIGMYGISVIATAVMMMIPFLLTANPIEQILQIGHRLFPVSRGLFEDKVSNVWCILHVVMKIKDRISPDMQLQLATACTLVTAILPCFKLLKDQSKSAMVNAMVTSSLAFFLFAFQVHEKHCLLFAVPAALMTDVNLSSNLFLIHTALFSLMPLAQKDDLLGYYLALRIVSFGVVILLRAEIKKDFQRINTVIPGLLSGTQGGFAAPFGALLLFQEILLYALAFERPPRRYPDLWPVIISAISCIVFGLFYLASIVYTFGDIGPRKLKLNPIHQKILNNREKKRN